MPMLPIRTTLDKPIEFPNNFIKARFFWVLRDSAKNQRLAGLWLRCALVRIMDRDAICRTMKGEVDAGPGQALTACIANIFPKDAL